MRLNCDIGEAFGICEMGADTALMEHVSLADVACGCHAGGEPAGGQRCRRGGAGVAVTLEEAPSARARRRARLERLREATSA